MPEQAPQMNPQPNYQQQDFPMPEQAPQMNPQPNYQQQDFPMPDSGFNPDGGNTP